MTHFSFYLYLITGVTILVLYIPFFILLNHQDPSFGIINDGVSLKGSSMSDVLKTSNLLITAHICIIVGVLPMILDLALDSHSSSKLPAMCGDRCMIIIILIVPSVTFLIFHESAFMPMLYIVQFLSQNMLYPAVMIHSVLQDITVVSPVIVPTLCLLSLTLFGVRCVFEAYATLFHFDDAPYRLAGSNVFMVLSWVVAFCAFMLGLYNLCTNGKFRVSSCRLQKLIPVLSFIVSAIAAIATRRIFHATSWPDTGEDCLVSYAFIQLLYSVFMTVLPGRIARLDAEMRMDSLTLKGIFVRYISHEIRSPLNVVVSGLDFLKDEVKALSGAVKGRLEGLIHEMTVASKSAVHILTDVLDYELIDSGMLKLNRSWFPLARFLEDKFKWAEIVASTKEIRLVIEDNTVSTAAGIRSLCDKVRVPRDSTVDGTDVEEGVVSPDHTVLCGLHCDSSRVLPPFARSFLHVDDSKIEQFLRDVVTNAINNSPVGGTVSVKVDFLPIVGSALATAADEVIGVLRIEVGDSGKGFAAEEQEKIAADFLRFNGRDLKGEGNVGLGLWIAQGIVNLHQGSFNLYSDGIEHGCRLVAELPLYSHPTTPLSNEEQRSFSNMLSATGELRDRDHWIGDKIGGAVDFPLTNAFADRTSEISPDQLFVFLPSEEDGDSNASGHPLSQQGATVSASAAEDLPGQAQEPVIDKGVAVGLCNAIKTESFHGTQNKVFTDAAKTPSYDRNERKMSELTAILPSLGKTIIVSGEAPTPRRTVDGLRFLIVDDSAPNRKIIRRILEGECKTFSNAVIEEADDGTSAVTAVQSVLAAGLSFDFIFMDFVMVKMNGPEAVEILRNSLKFNRTIIGVTGNALPVDMAVFRASGVDQIVLKPLNRTHFVSELFVFIDKWT